MTNIELLKRADVTKNYITENICVMQNCSQVLEDIQKDGLDAIRITSAQRSGANTKLANCGIDPELSQVLLDSITKIISDHLTKAEDNLKCIFSNINLPGF